MQRKYLTLQNHATSIKNLDIRIGQLANIIIECNVGTLPSNTILNQKEQIDAISFRNGREVRGHPSTWLNHSREHKTWLNKRKPSCTRGWPNLQKEIQKSIRLNHQESYEGKKMSSVMHDQAKPKRSLQTRNIWGNYF